MKIMLKRDTDLKDLETKVNENLAALEADGAEIMGIEHGTETLPVIRGKEIADYRTSYTVMIVYEPSRPGALSWMSRKIRSSSRRSARQSAAEAYSTIWQEQGCARIRETR